MSWIRSDSNPQALYVYECICNDDNGLQVMVGIDIWSVIPLDDWMKVFEQYDSTERETSESPIIVGDIKVEFDDKVKLTYKSHSIEMYDVTWQQLVNEYRRRIS